VHSSYCLTAEMRPNPCKDVICRLHCGADYLQMKGN
jgi:hypothetical protein